MQVPCLNTMWLRRLCLDICGYISNPERDSHMKLDVDHLRAGFANVQEAQLQKVHGRIYIEKCECLGELRGRQISTQPFK